MSFGLPIQLHGKYLVEGLLVISYLEKYSKISELERCRGRRRPRLRGDSTAVLWRRRALTAEFRRCMERLELRRAVLVGR